jgi:hypothetical protein
MESAVECRLTAARLLAGKLYLDTQPAKQPYRAYPDLGIKLVD